MPSPSDAGGFPPEGQSPGSDPAAGHEPRGGPTPQRPESPSGPSPGSPDETLRRLEQRLDRASEAAERLMAQVAGEAVRAAATPGAGSAVGGGGGAGEPGAGAGNPAGGATPPPAGWQNAEDRARSSTPELDPFVALVQAVRDLIPPDLQERLIAALREVLMALRALIDWYLERLDRRREQGVDVQDIPIL
jgi:hypothetical protein